MKVLSVKQIALQSILIVGLIGTLQAAPVESHVLHFPQDRSMGTLYMLDENDADNVNATWEMFGIAKEDVAIPEGMAVKLELSKEASTDLSLLRNLKPDDLTVLSARGTDITDN